LRSTFLPRKSFSPVFAPSFQVMSRLFWKKYLSVTLFRVFRAFSLSPRKVLLMSFPHPSSRHGRTFEGFLLGMFSFVKDPKDIPPLGMDRHTLQGVTDNPPPHPMHRPPTLRKVASFSVESDIVLVFSLPLVNWKNFFPPSPFS